MRSYGFDKFVIQIIAEFDTEEDLLLAEKSTIAFLREHGVNVYNVLDGGTGYFPIKDRAAWIARLKEKRQGKTPALGMKHTEENKKKFSEAGKKRWDIYGRYPDDVLNYGFSEANKKYGISKTHYYRLRKQSGKE